MVRAVICLLDPAAAAALDDVRAHFAAAASRVDVRVDRRTGQRRRPLAEAPRGPDRRGGTDRRRFVVPRRLSPLPAALAARTGEVAYVQRLLPVGPATEALSAEQVVAAVRARDAEAPTELYWRHYQRMHSRLSVLIGDPREVDAAVAVAFGALLDLLEDPERAGDAVEDLLYEATDAAAEEVVARRDAAHGVPEGGIEVRGAALDEPVRVVDLDHRWISAARTERERLAALLEPLAIALEHVGGSVLAKVPGRDTLDLLAGCRTPADAQAAARALVADGFEDCGDAGLPGRRYLRRRGCEPRVDVHVVERGGPLWTDALVLRDFLLRNAAEAERWGEVRRAAARTAPASAVRYFDLRRLALEELLERARREALTRAA